MAAGEYAELSSGWDGATCMAALGDDLFMISGGMLYRVDGSGEYVQIGEGGWDGATAMAAAGGALWIVNDGTLYRVEI